MDPLSVTLAVVSLAATVKDLVELGQKMHESFAKVSNNLRNAQRVAEDIKEMVEEIRAFCEDRKDALDNMKDFRVALQGLLSKFRSFETSILPLLPKTGRRKLGPFIRGWWNNSKIEDSILHLESDIVRVMRKYMMASTMRIEVKQGKNHQETIRGLAEMHNDVTQGLQALAIVERNVSAIAASTMPHRSHGSSASETNSEDFNRRVIMFAQSSPSTSAPMLRTPNMITEEVATTAYIKVQIDNIATIVEKMRMLPASADNYIVCHTVNIASFQLDSTHEAASMSMAHLRRYVVRQVTVVHDLLSTPGIHTISVQEGVIILDKLSTELNALNMRHESLLVGAWAIMLARILVNAPGGRHPGWQASLALCLYNQSIQHGKDGDDTQCLRTIEEAFTISQNLRNQHPENVHFQILHSIILLQCATLVDNQRSIELTIEAVQVLEDILDVQTFTLSNGQVQTVVQPTTSFFDRLFSLAPTLPAITHYASALRFLGNYMCKNGPGWQKSALELVHLGIAVHRKMVYIHGHVHKANLARTLLSLVHSEAVRYIPAEGIIDIADECIHLLRELTGRNPVFYARQLVNVLWSKANTLVCLNRGAEAIATLEEVTSLAEQILHDSALRAGALGYLSDQFRHLKRHNDAVRTGTLAITMYEEDQVRAIRYLVLSKDLQQVQRYKDSAEAARISVALCRRLAIGDPNTWMSHLTRGVSHLAHCLAALGDCAEALKAWKESVDMLDGFLKTNQAGSSDVLDRYLDALLVSRCLGYVVKDEIECVKISFAACQYLRGLLAIYPTMANVHLDLPWSEFSYANNLLRLGRLQDGQQVIDHWLDMRSCRPDVISSQFAAVYAAMMILKADVLDAQGCTEQALLTTMEVCNIVKLFISTDQDSFSQMIDSMVHEAEFQLDFGNSDQALQVAEAALQLSRDNKLHPIVDNLVWSLHATALTAFLCQNYKRAVEAAHEGCIMSSSSDWQDIEAEHNIFIRPSLWAILSSAEANLGRNNIALEHAHRAVEISLQIRDMKAHISATTAEKSYTETRGYLADILVATGDLSQARQICEERRAYFSKRVEKRMGEYRDLAPILRMLGILCCSEERHEEGAAAARELSQIMKTLGNIFPSLQDQVKVRLRRQTQVPILKVLDDIYQTLDCEHQTEVVCLFAI